MIFEEFNCPLMLLEQPRHDFTHFNFNVQPFKTHSAIKARPGHLTTEYSDLVGKFILFLMPMAQQKEGEKKILSPQEASRTH